MTVKYKCYSNEHTRLFSVRMKHDSLRVIGEAATRGKTTMSDFIRDAIQEKLLREDAQSETVTVG